MDKQSKLLLGTMSLFILYGLIVKELNLSFYYFLGGLILFLGVMILIAKKVKEETKIRLIAVRFYQKWWFYLILFFVITPTVAYFFNNSNLVYSIGQALFWMIFVY